ncbi:hypothetical protein CTA2_9397 [Colletotrichum tanaceti]|uniref:Uncharacterized protein n=1 Tax=Colletotrichum tanaceti TaxID=1306861 RepID=A0A4U6X3I4_9PEZI|nr:hypothetical protein CTA2_9397 [Colletotrichum tanaceti]TKW49932.1 hypothetical protein CTA1_4641 [Colletotrichum tanaceti]
MVILVDAEPQQPRYSMSLDRHWLVRAWFIAAVFAAGTPGELAPGAAFPSTLASLKTRQPL